MTAKLPFRLLKQLKRNGFDVAKNTQRLSADAVCVVADGILIFRFAFSTLTAKAAAPVVPSTW